MDAFADLKSESVEQTRSKKYDDPAHLKTRPLTVVHFSDRKRQLPPRAAVSLPQAGGSEVPWVFCFRLSDCPLS